MTRCSKTGFIVAKSHELRATDCTVPCFIVSLCERDKPIFVLVTQLSWLAELKMFTHYKFDGLEHRTYISEYECDFDMVDYYETAGPNPTVTELHDTINPSSLKTDWHLGHDFSMLEGVVTSELSPLGIFTLDNQMNVNAFLVFPFVQLPAIRVGRTIKLYNARCEGENEAVMCGRSYLEVVPDDDSTADDQPTDLPLANVGTATCGLAGYKWLERQFVTLRWKFHVGFLKKNVNCSIGSNAALISDLLLALIRATRDPTWVPSADSRTMQDFLLPSQSCLINAATTFPKTDYETLKSVCLDLEQLCKPFENEFFVHWSGTVTIDAIGYLNISTETGHWTLSDSTRSVSCITLADTPHLTEMLCGQFVLVRRCQAVVEKFYGANRRLKCTKLYFVLCEKTIEPLYDCSKDGSDFSVAAKITKYEQNTFCALCETSKKFWCPDTVGTCCNEDSATEDITLMDVDTSTENSDHRHPVVLHYVGTPFVQSSKPVCYALASVLQTDCHSNRDAAFPCVLLFRSLRPLQFLSPGACFYLGGPCPSSRPVQVGAQNLQSCVVFRDISPPHVCSPPVSWTDVRDEIVRDLHFAEGVVVERRELPINNQAERVGVGLEQYGIPGCKNLMVILDGPAGTHRIYVNVWQTRRYPLGLVPGATVFVTMLSRATAMSGNTYYQSTSMTCVKIRDIPDMRDFSCVGGRLPPINSLHIIGRGLLRSYQILSVSITAMCASCPGAVYRDARCPNKECQHSSADTNKEYQRSNANTSKDCEHSSVNTSQDCEHSIVDKTRDSERVVYDTRAKLFAKDPEGSCYVLVQDDNVRKLLELPSDIWAEILRWSQMEKIMFVKPFKDEERVPAATVQIEAVQLYCMMQRIKRRTVAVYCKRNSKDSQLWVCLEFCKLPAG